MLALYFKELKYLQINKFYTAVRLFIYDLILIKYTTIFPNLDMALKLVYFRTPVSDLADRTLQDIKFSCKFRPSCRFWSPLKALHEVALGAFVRT